MTETSTTSDNRGIAHVVEIDQMTLQNHAGQNIDCRAIFTEFQVSTSIFEPGMYGSVLIYDAHALITRFPIIGEETLYLSYATPGNSAKQGQFRVWKISDEEPDEKGMSSSYRLHFCSPELIVNSQKVVAKSYRNTDSVYDIIKDIQTNYLGTTKASTPGTLTMKDPMKVLVVPMYRPLEAIDMLLRRAYSGDNTKSDWYLFFERADGWQIKMLDELVTNPINAKQLAAGVVTQQQLDTSPDPNVQRLETWYVYASDKYVDDTPNGKDIRRVVSLKINGRFDSIQKIRMGMLENEVVQFSIVNKAVTAQNYGEIANGQLYLGDTDQSIEYGPQTSSQGKKRTNTDQFIANYSTPASGLTGTQASQVFFRLKDPQEKDGVVKKSGWLYQAARTAFEQVAVTITVPGDTMVDAGDIVHLAVPKFESVLNQGENDDFLYGRYIVGSIRDSVLTPDKHVMTLDLWKDAYGIAIQNSQLQDENTQ